MTPTKEKQEHKYVPPTWIDKKLIKTLSKAKQKYWANRILGIPGQGKKPNLNGKVVVASPAETGFDNDGNMIVRNRAARRNRPATPAFYTKSTHSLKKLRGQLK